MLQTLWDKDLVHFYSGKHGSAKAWADKTQRRFRIVIGKTTATTTQAQTDAATDTQLHDDDRH